MDEVEDFLAHYGVKGMKWGERKARTSTSSKSQSKPSAPKGPPSQGREALKKVGTELGFGAIGPAAMLAGLGPPVSIAIGVSVAVLRQPPVRTAIANTSKATADLMKEIGDTKISAMKQASELRKEAKEAAQTTKRAVSR